MTTATATDIAKTTTRSKQIRSCSIWRALEIVGDTPTLLLMESYWLGTRRFDDFCRQTGLLKTVVSDRLKRLIKNDCLVKIAYNDKPKRFEYRATEQFRDCYPLALAMLNWEREWGAKAGKITVALTHTRCGHTTEPTPVCQCCRGAIDPREVAWEVGPGVGLSDASYSRRRRQSNQSSSNTNLFDNIVRVIGDRWATLIIRSLFTGINRYKEILEDTAMATNILADRLSELGDEGIIYTVTVPGDGRRIEYKLTKKGLAIYPILLTLLQWGDKWLPAEEGPPLLLTHIPCGNPLQVEMACSHCGQEVLARETRYTLQLNRR